MFPSLTGRHSQIAYVTNDLDRALAVWRDQFGVPAFHVFANDAPGMETSHPFQLNITSRWPRSVAPGSTGLIPVYPEH